MILTSHFPHRWRDLMSYKLLILRTHWQYTGRVWLAYDFASTPPRRNWLTGRRSMYNCTAFLLPGPRCVVDPMVCLAIYLNHSEPLLRRSSADRGTVSCRFAHCCSNCGGPHRAHGCSIRTETSTKTARTRRSPSPPVSSSSTKSRRHWRLFPCIDC